MCNSNKDDKETLKQLSRSNGIIRILRNGVKKLNANLPNLLDYFFMVVNYGVVLVRNLFED